MYSVKIGIDIDRYVVEKSNSQDALPKSEKLCVSG